MQPDSHTERQLTAGRIAGRREGEVLAWRGIPYAAPPVGPLRWRAPQPPQPWAGVRPALQHGAIAPQYAGLLAPVPPAQHGRIVGDEDCLTLSVFAPPDARGAPVMVWIHGGGNAVGTGATYDVARQLAVRHGVVVVTLNYRLGVLGWFNHPALQQQAGVSDEERSGNFALLDLLAALRWVQREIAVFGGDPGQVTIFGESAGGQNVLLLLASPLAAGLFQRAIAQSPVAETFSAGEALHGRESPLDSRRLGGLEVASRLGVPERGAAEALRALPVERLLKAYTPGSVGIYLAPRPARDGVTLPLAPLDEVFASGRWNRVPVILGSNRDESRTFCADKPEHVRLLGGKLPILRDRAAYEAEMRFMSDAWRALHVEWPADAMLAGGHAEVWTYRFDWDEAPRIPFIRPDLLLGAAHAMEMAFAFGDEAGEFDPFRVNTPFNRAGRVALARDMSAQWAAFARSGQPLAPWARRTPAAGEDSLVFDSAAGGGVRMAAARRDIATLKRTLHDAPLAPALRCRIYARLFLWSPLFEGHGSEAEYRQWCAEWGIQTPAGAHRPAVEI